MSPNKNNRQRERIEAALAGTKVFIQARIDEDQLLSDPELTLERVGLDLVLRLTARIRPAMRLPPPPPPLDMAPAGSTPSDVLAAWEDRHARREHCCPPGDVSIPEGLRLPPALEWVRVSEWKVLLVATCETRSDGRGPEIGLVSTGDDYDAALFLTTYGYRRRGDSNVFARRDP